MYRCLLTRTHEALASGVSTRPAPAWKTPDPDASYVAKAMMRRVAARRRNESSDADIGDACLWAQVNAGRTRAPPAGTGEASVDSNR